MSMRLEKGWGAWGLEFRPDFDAHESGMDIFINWDKDFVGKEASLAAKNTPPKQKLVSFFGGYYSLDSYLRIQGGVALRRVPRLGSNANRALASPAPRHHHTPSLERVYFSSTAPYSSSAVRAPGLGCFTGGHNQPRVRTYNPYTRAV